MLRWSAATLLALAPLAAGLSARFVAGDRAVRFRSGAAADQPAIFRAMVAQLMNPLALRVEHFLVADDDAGSGRVGFGQIRPVGSDLWELASVYVDDDWRGRGVGSELVRQLLAGHAAAGRPPCEVHLLTLDKTRGFYRALGFEQLSIKSAPAAMRPEMIAGSAITKLLGEELACMRFEGRA